MEKILKPKIALVLVVALCFSSILSTAAFAAKTTAELDKRYWKLQEAYNAALAASNHKNIIKTGEDIITLFLGSVNPVDCQKKADAYFANQAIEINILDGVFSKVAVSYEALGDFKNMVRTYKNGFPFIKAYHTLNKLDGSFAYTYINNKISFYDVKSTVYAQVNAANGDTVYHSAKYEPKTGVLFGEVYNVEDEKRSPAEKTSSASLIYVLFETETIESFDWFIRPISESKNAIEIAWNLSKEGEGLKDVLNQRAKIERAAEYINSLGTPVFLRFGAEMNVWSKPADPKEFIDAYRFIAKIMREKSPNAALVWSVNSVSAEGKTYEMFYPGDEYVDWVGVSLYCSKYFLGKADQSDATQATYLTGKYSNPIKQIEPLINLYGDKKPIMIAEGGVENYSISNKTDETKWATTQMKLFYEFLPIIYPQVKAIFYFNTVGVKDAKNRYTLYDNKAIEKLYGELTANSYFIKQGNSASETSYKKLGTVTLPANSVSLAIYSPYFDRANIAKTYRLDTKWIGAGDRQKFDFSSYSDGLHTLTIDVTEGTNIIETVTIYVKKSGSTVTLSDTILK